MSCKERETFLCIFLTSPRKLKIKNDEFTPSSKGFKICYLRVTVGGREK